MWTYWHRDNHNDMKNFQIPTYHIQSTNIFIARFTTAYVQLELCGVLEGLNKRHVYRDTNPIIFIGRKTV